VALCRHFRARAPEVFALLDIARFSKQTAKIRGHHYSGERVVNVPGEDQQLTESQASRISYTLASSLESVDRVEQTAEELAKKAGIDEDEIYRITMAVREAAVNAVLHGNSYDPDKVITATFENTGNSLVIRITDQGKGLDPDTLPDPLAPENLLRGSGRGIFLIRSFMDEVHFRQLHPGTELTLIKHLGTAQTGS
jgi:serine/threonine-protein kinase RsbW